MYSYLANWFTRKADEGSCRKTTNKRRWAEKLKLPDHFEASRENRSLVRGVGAVDCDHDAPPLVLSIYHIVKDILSYLPWQDRVLCKQVSSTWRSAVDGLTRDRIESLHLIRFRKVPFKVRITNDSFSEPMVVLVFAFTNVFRDGVGYLAHKCNRTEPCPCLPPCGKRHFLLDLMQYQLCGPKNCMLTVWTRTSFPVPPLAAVCIPAIPGVEFRVINIKYSDLERHERDVSTVLKRFRNEIDKLALTSIFKGALVFHCEAEYSSHYVEHLKNVQPDIPYAIAVSYLGPNGYISDQSDIGSIIDRYNREEKCLEKDLTLSVGLFCVPKNIEESSKKCNLEMFSLVIEKNGCEGENPIIEFANRIPRFEHSVAIDFPVRGYGGALEDARERFRLAGTPLVSCCSEAVYGVDHPTRPQNNLDCIPSGLAFVYIGWGKVVAPATQPSGPAV